MKYENMEAANRLAQSIKDTDRDLEALSANRTSNSVAFDFGGKNVDVVVYDSEMTEALVNYAHEFLMKKRSHLVEELSRL